MNPVVHPRLAQRKEFPQERLQGGGLEIDQQEQQFLFRRVEYTFAATAREPVPGLARQGLVGTVEPLIGLREGGQRELKFPKRQLSEGQELPAVILRLCGFHHEADVLLFVLMRNTNCCRKDTTAW